MKTNPLQSKEYDFSLLQIFVVLYIAFKASKAKLVCMYLCVCVQINVCGVSCVYGVYEPAL